MVSIIPRRRRPNRIWLSKSRNNLLYFTPCGTVSTLESNPSTVPTATSECDSLLSRLSGVCMCRARCAAEPRAEAHGRLLPAQVTALMSLYNTPRSAVASRHPPAQDPTARTDAATGVGSPTPVAAPAAAQASNSTGVSTGASSEEGLEPVTGLWQRMAAFLYKRALEGEEIGLSDLFDSSYPQDRCNRDVSELVNIVQRSTSLADAMERMTGVPPHSRPAPSPAAAGPADASVSKALRQFHRYRADLDSLFISAVHLLQAGRLLMLLTSRRNRLMPMVVLYDWEADTVLFASALYTVKVVVCMMWCVPAAAAACALAAACTLFCLQRLWQHTRHVVARPGPLVCVGVRASTREA